MKKAQREMIKILKKIIIMENNNEIQCNTLEEVVKVLIDEEYYNLETNQKIKKLKIKALQNTIGNKMQILENLQANQIEDINEKFIIKDETTYILSLLTTNKILMLERIDANIFAKDIDKTKIENNYIVLNKFAKELLYNKIVKKNDFM